MHVQKENVIGFAQSKQLCPQSRSRVRSKGRCASFTDNRLASSSRFGFDSFLKSTSGISKDAAVWISSAGRPSTVLIYYVRVS